MISVIQRYKKAVPLAALAMSVFPAARASAGVEYVTPTSNCTSKAADLTAHQTLTVFAGQNLQFEVWGNSVDLSNPSSGFTVNAPAGFSAKIVKQTSGPQNFTRGCGNVGSAVVQLSAPKNLTSDATVTLSFKMPFGDFSDLPVTVRAHPTFTTTWTTNGSLSPSNLPCIVKTGSITSQNQDLKLVIDLPPGAAQDQSTCTSNVITIKAQPAAVSSVNIYGSPQKYQVTGLPAFLSESQATPVLAAVGTQLTFTFNVAAIRALTAPSTSTITIVDTTATSRTATLTLVVKPSVAPQGFAQTASPNPASVQAGNPVDFTITLSAPAQSQFVTWRMTQPQCFAVANPQQAPYFPNLPFQLFKFPAGQTSAIIRVISVAGGGCVSRLNPIQHIFEAWIGDFRTNPQVTAVTSGPSYTRTTVSLVP